MATQTRGVCGFGRPCGLRLDEPVAPSCAPLVARRRGGHWRAVGGPRSGPGETGPSARRRCGAHASACGAWHASGALTCACGWRRPVPRSRRFASWIASRSPADGRALRLSGAPSTTRWRWLAWWIVPRACPRGRGGSLRARTLPPGWMVTCRRALRFAHASAFPSRAYLLLNMRKSRNRGATRQGRSRTNTDGHGKSQLARAELHALPSRCAHPIGEWNTHASWAE